MRTVILVGCMMFATAINPDFINTIESYTHFIGWTTGALITMDILSIKC